MRTLREVCRLSIALVLAVGCSTTIAQTPAAKPPAASPPAAGAVASGQAVGTLTANGKTIKLAYAYAFVDEGEKKSPVILPHRAAGSCSDLERRLRHHDVPHV